MMPKNHWRDGDGGDDGYDACGGCSSVNADGQLVEIFAMMVLVMAMEFW